MFGFDIQAPNLGVDAKVELNTYTRGTSGDLGACLELVQSGVLTHKTMNCNWVQGHGKGLKLKPH